jgi:DnaJ homolog subfamily A member 2
VQEVDHPVFKRQGCDLVMQKEITLQEALCGTKFVVNHVDGKQFIVDIPRGEVTS